MPVATFAADTVPLAAETVWRVGNFEVTNAMLYGAVVSLALVVGLLYLAHRSHANRATKPAIILEWLVDYVLRTAKETFGDETKARLHVPFLLTLFVFILIANLSGLVPGVGSITISNAESTSPLLRPLTTDLNATLALAIFAIGSVQVYAIRQFGLLRHLRNYFSDKPWQPLNLFIGINEVFSELLRILTLSMRLFGVIYAGKVLIYAIAALAGNFGWLAAVPFIFMELFFCLIQAYIFMTLTMVYLSIATARHETRQANQTTVATS